MFFRLLVTAVLVFTVVGCTTIESAGGVPRVYQAAIADTVTTAYAVNHGAQELNPLGFAGATAGKLVYLLYLRRDIAKEDQLRYDRLATSLWTGAATSNSVQILLPGTGLFLGLAVGVYVAVSVWQTW